MSYLKYLVLLVRDHIDRYQRYKAWAHYHEEANRRIALQRKKTKYTKCKTLSEIANDNEAYIEAHPDEFQPLLTIRKRQSMPALNYKTRIQ